MQELTPPPDNRDRDDAGRPRNARARDELGRPLPRSEGSADPDQTPALPALEALARAQRLLDDGRPFAAHEVLEAVWKDSVTGDDERELWRALAQLAVGITHGLRGNPTGARTLLDRAADNLIGFSGTTPHGVDVDGLRAWALDTPTDAAALRRTPRLTA